MDFHLTEAEQMLQATAREFAKNEIEPVADADVAEQADHRRQLERDRDAVDFAVVDGYDLHFALAQQCDRLLPVDDLQRLERRVEEERLLHARIV